MNRVGMILTCPECATRYSVADNSVGPEGRTVRCANCGLTWRAEAEGALDLEAPPVAAPAVSGDELPRAFRERIAQQRQGRRAAKSGLLIGGAAAGFLLAIISVVAGRESVVGAWPKTASAYAAVGLPVNSVGLVIEDQAAQVGWEEGRPTVLVTGRLRNVRNKPVASPPLRFTLLDGEENDLGTRISRVANADVPAGGTRRFTAKLHNPPESVQDVEIGFHLGEGEAEPAHGPEVNDTPMKTAHAPAPDEGSAESSHAALRPAHDEPAH